MKRTITGSLLLGVSLMTNATISTDLDGFINGLGYASNTTAPRAFESQAAGFFGGGSLHARNQVRQYQLVQLDLPSYRAGCGGIDLFTGSLSFLSHEKLVDLGKQVMTNSGAYAVDVMLATTVPELKQVRDYLQTLEQMANQANVNSCEISKNFVGGIWPKTAESQKKICHDQGTQGKTGLFSDYVTARMECSGNGFDRSMEKAGADPVTKKQVVLNKNLVWSLLQDNAFLGNDPELAEMVMSLTGTIIIDKQGKITRVPSLAGSADLINALLGTQSNNSKAKLWHCSNTTDCLSVQLKEANILETSTLTARVREIINGLNEKLLHDQAADVKEKNFLSLTPFPVLRFLSILNSTQYASAAVDMSEYAELIAHDLLQNYLHELLQQVTHATEGSVLNEDLVRDIQGHIKDASRHIAAIEPKVGQKLQEKLALIERMARIEKQVASSMNSTLH